MIDKSKWIWMPHAGHCIIGHMCRFHLTTKVGKYIISTIGEWWPERSSREITASIKDKKWHEKNKHLFGDEYDFAYFKKFGYSEIGCDRIYETMVFKAKKNKEDCCPYIIANGFDLDFKGYNDAKSAFKGHMRMCNKWAKKVKKK